MLWRGAVGLKDGEEVSFIIKRYWNSARGRGAVLARDSFRRHGVLDVRRGDLIGQGRPGFATFPRRRCVFRMKHSGKARLLRVGRYLWKEWFRPLLVAAAIVLPFKSAIADWNWVPSG